MAACSPIELVLHRGEPDQLLHSARSRFNIALASPEPTVSLSALAELRQKIEDCLRGSEKLTQDELEAIGDQLAQIVFNGSVRQLYEAAANGCDVELAICAKDPILKSIPWEFLLWPDVRCAPHRARTVCRLVEATQYRPLEALSLGAGIRVLLVVSSPTDQSAVEWVETERMLQAQIGTYTPQSDAKMTFELCEASAPNQVRAEVQRIDPHIVHFIGHGAPDSLLFTKHQSSTSRPVPSAHIHSVLAAESTRLIVLTACDTGNVGTEIEPLIPIAEKLVQAGVPAVVANQLPISLRSIHTFCGALYTELLKTGNIDRAVNAGRVAMGVEFSSLNVAALEWGVPVLYRRPDCSDLFSVEGDA